MSGKNRRFGIALLLSIVLASPVSARVEWRMEKALPISGTPLDVAATADGKRVFVLLENGEVRIYSPEGELEESLGVVGRGDRLAVSPSGDRLYLSSRQEKTLQIASLDTIHAFDLSGSPFRGAAEAAVEVVVFSDFQ